MRLPLLCFANLLALAATASGQSFVESFSAGHNEGDFVIWNENFNEVVLTGGNPGAFLRLENIMSGSATCAHLEIVQNTWPNEFSGDYRARSVSSLGIDVNIVEVTVAFGPLLAGEWRLKLWNDAGTPADDADDCAVVIIPGLAPPTTPGWTTFDIPFDSASQTLPPNAVLDGACVNMDSNVVWNNVITDVDYVEFFLDASLSAPCGFSLWDMGIDNLRVEATPPPVGTPYCQSLPNSSGSAATISAVGHDAVAMDYMFLRAEGLPIGVNGISYYGTTQTNVPFGGGFRCVAGQVCRLPVTSANEDGVMITRPTLGPGAQPLPACDILAGSTWFFQAWFRDPMAGGFAFNLSDALAVTFQ